MDIKTERDHIDMGGGMLYKPVGLNTYVPMRLDLYKDIKNSDSNEENLSVLKTKLEENGFKSIGIMPFQGSAGPEIFGYLNSDSNTVCEMYGDSYSARYGAGDYVVLECAKTDWSWLTDDEKNLVSELETAYYDKNGKYPTVISNIENKIKDSEYSPYQNLKVNIGGAAGLFYRTSPDAKWQFFVGTQSVLDCSDYNTDDLKKAYVGEVCYDTVTRSDSTVQL